MPSKPKEHPKPAPRFRIDERISPEHANWQLFVEEHCESPAELAFLRAMISSLGMRPNLGALISKGVRLDLQVEEGRYRVDFLINHWLVVEIDGAAFHSSPEAKKRDEIRDRYFESLGYSVLRIPAKLVFDNPDRTVDQVQAALLIGRPEMPTPAPTPTTGLDRLAQTAASFSKSIEIMERKSALRHALSEANAALLADKSVLDHALNMASSQLQHQAWISSLDEEMLEHYHQSLSYMNAATIDVVVQRPNEIMPNITFKKPKATGDAEFDEEVEVEFLSISLKRSSVLSKIKTQIQESEELHSIMRSSLSDLGRSDLWDEMTGAGSLRT